MKQVILITDGCSNVGVSPVVAAAHALAEGIVVNVVGIIDQADMSEKGSLEIKEIAEAGGGLSRIVNPKKLAQTMQMLTRKTVAHTIQQVVSRELKQIIGNSDMETLHPDKRAQIVETMDELSETVDLQVVLLIDASASMKPKLPAVEEAIQDLMLSLQARTGRSEMSVFHFPGNGEDAHMDQNWTCELAKLQDLFYKLNMKGTTPTGPALLHVIRFFKDHRKIGQQTQTRLHKGKDGMLSDFVV